MHTGDNVDCKEVLITAIQDVPTGHKIALCNIPKGALIVKYGVPIGKAKNAIKKGQHVHIDNVEDITEELCINYANKFRKEEY